MALSVTTAFMQPFGIINAMPRLGVGNVLRATGQWVGDAVQMENTFATIAAKSPMMRHRSVTMNRELYEISKIVQGKSKAARIADASLFFFTTKMQLVADVPTWLAGYNKSMQENPGDEQLAIDQADRAVIETQGSGSTKDLAKVQRDHPFLTQFMSYFSATYQQVVEKTKETDFKNPAAVAGWLADMAMLCVIPAIVPSLLMHAIRGGGDDDEPEKLAKRLAIWQAQYLLSPFVLARELTGAVQGFDYAGPPAARVFVDLAKLGKQVYQWEPDEDLFNATANFVGDVTGLPTTQLLRSLKGWKAWEDGKEGAGPQSVLFGPPPKD
jgi:hypothetical protein